MGEGDHVFLVRRVISFISLQQVRLSPASMEPEYWEQTAELSICSGDHRKSAFRLLLDGLI